MTRSAEATFWQAVGAVIGIAGGSDLGYALGKYGLASIEPKALMLGIAGSFLLLTGGACYIAGRALHVEESVLGSREATLWKLLATVCLVAGGVVVVVAWRQSNTLMLDRLTMGLAGAFSMMFGVLCLVGERVMSRMHDALVANKPVARAATARP
ncbi:MAG TPA: hypothetical protein VII23_18905 [Terriglobales bacterium]|jgi:hypothetical protein